MSQPLVAVLIFTNITAAVVIHLIMRRLRPEAFAEVPARR